MEVKDQHHSWGGGGFRELHRLSKPGSLETAQAVEGQHPCRDHGTTAKSSTPVGLYETASAVRPALQHGSRGLHRQSRAGNPAWVEGTAPAVKGRHSCLGRGDCTSSQGPALLHG